MGEYLAFQDSDDEWNPEKLKKQMDVFNEIDPEYGVVYSDMLGICEDNTTFYWKSPKVIVGTLINKDTNEYHAWGLAMPSTVIRRVCFEKVGFFDERLPRLVDLDLFIRLSKLYIFYQIKEPLVRYSWATPGRILSDNNNLWLVRKLIFEKKTTMK